MKTLKNWLIILIIIILVLIGLVILCKSDKEKIKYPVRKSLASENLDIENIDIRIVEAQKIKFELKELEVQNKILNIKNFKPVLGSNGNVNSWYQLWNKKLKQCAIMQNSDYCSWKGNFNKESLENINKIINKK